MKRFLKILLIFHSSFLFSQNNTKNDSLENLLNSTDDRKKKIEILLTLSESYSQNNHQKSLSEAREALALSEKVSFSFGILKSKYLIGILLQDEGNYKDALANFLEVLKKLEDPALGNRGKEEDSLLLRIYNSMGNNYSLQERREEGLAYFLKALEMARKLKMKTSEGTILGNIGNFYYYESYDFASNNWDTIELKKALNYFYESAEIHMAQNDTSSLIAPLMNYSLVQIDLGNVLVALDTLRKLEAICLKRNDIGSLVYIYSNLAQAFMNLEKTEEAFRYYEKSIEMAGIVKDKNSMMNVYALISDAFAERKNYKEAYENYVKYSGLRDSLLSEESTRSVSEMQTKYETAKKEEQIELQAMEISKKQAFIYAGSFGLLVLAALVLVVFRGYRQKQRSNEIISQQKLIVEEKNRNITDSILYASRIQRAILPEQDLFRNMFPDSFIFYRPRDIVSGDFYWYSEKGDFNLLAVADCTGHGVPGAMMSMVGSSLLHQIVNEKTIKNPVDVITELDKQIIRSLKQKGAEGESREGMDIGFVEINRKTNFLRFSGANRPLYLIRNGKLEEISGSKHPIGSVTRKTKSFVENEIQLQPGDCLYLTTDGISDQFGGKTNKKFMARRFKESLLAIFNSPMEKQKEELVSIIDDWKGNYEQVDDVCVVGIRI